MASLEKRTGGKGENSLEEISKFGRIGVWELNIQTSEMVVSDVVYELHEIPKGKKFLLNKAISYYRKDHRTVISKALDHAIQHKRSYDLEVCLITTSGKELWVRTIGRPIVEKGTVKKLQGLIQDIDSQKRATLLAIDKLRSLQELHRRHKAIVDNLPGVALDIEWSSAGGIKLISVSSKCKEITTYSLNEIRSRSASVFKGIIVETDHARIEREILKSVNTGSFEIRFRLVDREGKLKWCLGTGRAIRKHPDNIRIIGMVFDHSKIVANEHRTQNAMILGADNERRRIAEEMHDGVQQTLTASQILFEFVSTATDCLPKGHEKRFYQAYDQLKLAIKEIRDLSHEVMPKSVNDFGLVTAVEGAAMQIGQTLGLKITFNQTLGGLKLKTEAEMHLFRVFQGALNNIIKHSKSSNVQISLLKSGEKILMTIKDDGIGFDPGLMEGNITGSLGLFSMQNRVEMLNGNIEVHTHPGEGTTIAVEIPIKENI